MEQMNKEMKAFTYQVIHQQQTGKQTLLICSAFTISDVCDMSLTPYKQMVLKEL